MRGLCFCGGGIKAASHIGALKALEEKNIKFDCYLLLSIMKVGYANA